MRFTKAIRQRIVRDFAAQNGGVYSPAAFLQHVKATGPDHEAYGWFEWDDDAAADAYRIDQAREFAQGLVVTFKVEEIHRGKMVVVDRSAPMFISPVGTRKAGGYVEFDPATDIPKLAAEAERDLTWFLSRYEIVLGASGVAAVEKLIAQVAALTMDAAA